MQTRIELPDAIYREGERIARAKGLTLERLIVSAVEREITHQAETGCGHCEVSLPLVQSVHPGTLNLSDFDFDDLLA